MDELFGFLNLYSELDSAISDVFDFIRAAGVIFYITVIALVLFTYLVRGYMLMCVGRKAHLSDDWMPYVPIARQVYQMRIGDCPWWYVLLFQGCFISGTILSLLFVLFANFFETVVLALFVSAAYYIVTMVFTFRYYRRYYERFGFNPNTAWVEIIWTFRVLSQVFLGLVAFLDSIRFCREGEKNTSHAQSGNYGGAGYDDDSHTVALGAGNAGMGNAGGKRALVVGLSGKYEGASFDISDGVPVIFGRSATDANIVFDQFETDISRKHCTIQWDGNSGQFTVTDQSTNGTYLEDGSKFSTNRPVSVARGTVIYLGKNKKNSFRLG